MVVYKTEKYLKELCDCIEYFIFTSQNKADWESFCNGRGSFSEGSILRKIEKFLYNYKYRVSYQKRFKHNYEEDTSEPFDYPIFKFLIGYDMDTVSYMKIKVIDKDSAYIILNNEDFSEFKRYFIKRESIEDEEVEEEL